MTRAFRNWILAHPSVYSTFSWVVAGPRTTAKYRERYIRPTPGMRILDIGCGPADILAQFPASVHYEGFDANPAYIERARRAYAGRDARFHCQFVSLATLAEPGTWDLVLAIGLVHHLGDQEAGQLFRLAHAALRPGGRMVTIDGVYVPGQARMAKWIISQDRGRFVRTPEAYDRLAQGTFSRVAATVDHGLLRIPYTLYVMEMTKDPGA